MKQRPPLFLTLAEVVAIHDNQIRLYGGEPGTRDMRLLSSALAVPRASFDGDYLHADIFEMAAAYAFHVCQNHPFIDGNKCVALVAALYFLDINGIEVDDPQGSLYELMMGVSRGDHDKKAIARVLRGLALADGA